MSKIYASSPSSNHQADYKSEFNREFGAMYAHVAGAVDYLDTLWVRLHQRLSKEQASELRALNNNGNLYFQHLFGASYPFKVVMQRPTDAAVAYFADVAQHHYVNRVDLAFDLLTRDQAATRQLQEFFYNHLLQRWHGKRRIATYYSNSKLGEKTIYFGKAWSGRNLTLYSDRPSKLSGTSCLHAEIRVTGAAQCRRYHIGRLSEILQIDPFDILRRNLKFSIVDKQAVEKLAEDVGKRERRILVRQVQDSDMTPSVDYPYQPTCQLWIDYARYYSKSVVKPIAFDVGMAFGDAVDVAVE